MFKHCVLSVPPLGPVTLPHLTVFAKSPFLPHAASSPQNPGSSVFADSYALKPELPNGSNTQWAINMLRFDPPPRQTGGWDLG